DGIIASLQEVQNNLEEENEEIETLITTVVSLKEDIATVQGKTDDIKAFIGNNEQFFKDLLESIGSVTDIDLQAFVEKYEDEIEPKMIAERHAGQATVNKAKGMINHISKAIPEIEKILNETHTKIDE